MHCYNSVGFVCNPRNLGGSGVQLPGAKFDKYETPDCDVITYHICILHVDLHFPPLLEILG